MSTAATRLRELAIKLGEDYREFFNEFSKLKESIEKSEKLKIIRKPLINQKAEQTDKYIDLGDGLYVPCVTFIKYHEWVSQTTHIITQAQDNYVILKDFVVDDDELDLSKFTVIRKVAGTAVELENGKFRVDVTKNSSLTYRITHPDVQGGEPLDLTVQVLLSNPPPDDVEDMIQQWLGSFRISEINTVNNHSTVIAIVANAEQLSNFESFKTFSWDLSPTQWEARNVWLFGNLETSKNYHIKDSCEFMHLDNELDYSFPFALNIAVSDDEIDEISKHEGKMPPSSFTLTLHDGRSFTKKFE